MERKSFDSNFKGMLNGVRVVDLSRVVAGNMVTLQLADHGADVIKIEPMPNGDPLRQWRDNGYSTYWKVYCRNKRSLGLNFRSDGASDLIRDLACQGDVLVEGFRPGTLEKMGLAPDTLLEANPNLVIVRVSGFNRSYSRPGLARRGGVSDLPPLWVCRS